MSSIQLKEVIHFYLGCEVETINRFGGTQTYTISYSNIARLLGSGYVSVKPLLRPLSDMTESEVVELFKRVSLLDLGECVFDFHNDETEMWCNAELNGSVIDTITIKGCRVEMMNNDGSFSPINPQATVFLFFLSKCFDLFNLIENNLAIDSAKTKP